MAVSGGQSGLTGLSPGAQGTVKASTPSPYIIPLKRWREGF